MTSFTALSSLKYFHARYRSFSVRNHYLCREKRNAESVIKLHSMKKSRARTSHPLAHCYLAAFVFALLVYGFWSLLYPFVITGREQFSIFLWNSEFFQQYIIVPGGLAKYAGDFIVQFFYRYSLGALLLTLLLVAVQWTTWLLIRRLSAVSPEDRRTPSAAGFPFSFIPSLLLLFMLGNPLVSITFVTAVAMTLLLMVMLPRGFVRGVIYVAVAVPLGYWLLGPAVVMLPVYAAFVWIHEGTTARRSLIAAVLLLILLFFCMFLSSWITPYPTHRIFFGIDYHWDFASVPYGLLFWMLFTALLPFMAAKVSKYLSGLKMFWAVVCAEILLGVLLVPRGYQNDATREMEYDMLLGMNRWSDIIQRSQKQLTLSPISSTVTSLAQKQLGQIPTQQLMKEFSKHRLDHYRSTTLVISEVMFRIGMANISQRMAFEMMEHIPNYNKSARALKRLAETNIIIGEYDVALKYISLLDETLFYRNWAKMLRQLAEHPEEVESHPLYGNLRKMYQQTEDYFFI